MVACLFSTPQEAPGTTQLTLQDSCQPAQLQSLYLMRQIGVGLVILLRLLHRNIQKEGKEMNS